MHIFSYSILHYYNLVYGLFQYTVFHFNPLHSSILAMQKQQKPLNFIDKRNCSKILNILEIPTIDRRFHSEIRLKL